MLQLLLNSYKRWCTWGKDKHITHELLIEQNLWLRQTTIWYFSFCHLKPGTLNWEFYYDYTSGCSEAPRTMAESLFLAAELGRCPRISHKEIKAGNLHWSQVSCPFSPLQISYTYFLMGENGSASHSWRVAELWFQWTWRNPGFDTTWGKPNKI